jgi:hypothetical protein
MLFVVVVPTISNTISTATVGRVSQAASKYMTQVTLVILSCDVSNQNSSNNNIDGNDDCRVYPWKLII